MFDQYLGYKYLLTSLFWDESDSSSLKDPSHLSTLIFDPAAFQGSRTPSLPHRLSVINNRFLSGDFAHLFSFVPHLACGSIYAGPTVFTSWPRRRRPAGKLHCSSAKEPGQTGCCVFMDDCFIFAFLAFLAHLEPPMRSLLLK